MTRYSASVWLLLLAWLISPLASAIEAPGDDGFPIRIAPQLSVEKIDEISDKDGTCIAEIGIGLEWKDRRLMFNAVTEGRDSHEYLNEAALSQLTKIWKPNVTVLNQAENPRTLSTTLVVRADGSVRSFERLVVKVRIDWELNDYPFDRQTILWRLGSTTYGREEVVLRSGTITLAPKLVIKNWGIERTVQSALERPGITGRPIAALDEGIVIKRQSYVAVTQIFLPYLAIMFMPLISLLNVSSSTPTQLFTALLALLTLNFKIVLEQPAIISVSNSVVDAMWMGYCYIGITLLLALTIMRAPGERMLSDPVMELRSYTKWGPPLIYLVLLGGRVLAAV